METLLRMPKVVARVGLARPTIYKMIKAGSFPRPVKLGDKAVAWRESTIEEWIAGRQPA